MKTVLIAIVVLAAVAAGTFFAMSRKSDNTTTTDSTTTTNQASDLPATETPANNETPDEEQPANLIAYTNNGFEPGNLTVKAGSQVTVKNDSSSQLEFASDPHPAHTENQELNQDVIPAGESKTFTPNKTGTYGFHNHLNSSHTGTIIVQ